MSLGRAVRISPRFTYLLVFFLFLGLSLISVPMAHAQVSVAWTTRYGAPGQVADPVDMASDAQGNSYVAANVAVTSSAPHNEILTIKYDPAGNIVWKNWLGSSAHPAQAQAIALDSGGNVYVLGALGETTSSTATIATSAFAVIKYTPAGARSWVKYTPPVTGGDNFPTKLAVTAAGDVYVTGSSYPADHKSSQALTIKYDSAGNVLWSHRNPQAGAGTNVPMGLGLDATENLYIGVQSSHFVPTVYKLDSAGNLRGTFASPALGDFSAFHVDSIGNFYAAGCHAPGPIAIKWDTNGNELWRHAFTPTRCFFGGIGVDSHGNVSLGETLGSSSPQSAIADLDVNGNLQWEKIVGSGYSESLAVDSNDQIYLAASGSATVAKYSPDGQQLWVQGVSDNSNMLIPRAMALAPGGRVVVTADSVHFSTSFVESDVLTFSLSQTGP